MAILKYEEIKIFEKGNIFSCQRCSIIPCFFHRLPDYCVPKLELGALKIHDFPIWSLPSWRRGSHMKKNEGKMKKYVEITKKHEGIMKKYAPLDVLETVPGPPGTH